MTAHPFPIRNWRSLGLLAWAALGAALFPQIAEAKLDGPLKNAQGQIVKEARVTFTQPLGKAEEAGWDEGDTPAPKDRIHHQFWEYYADGKKITAEEEADLSYSGSDKTVCYISAGRKGAASAVPSGKLVMKDVPLVDVSTGHAMTGQPTGSTHSIVSNEVDKEAFASLETYVNGQLTGIQCSKTVNWPRNAHITLEEIQAAFGGQLQIEATQTFTEPTLKDIVVGGLKDFWSAVTPGESASPAPNGVSERSWADRMYAQAEDEIYRAYFGGRPGGAH